MILYVAYTLMMLIFTYFHLATSNRWSTQVPSVPSCRLRIPWWHCRQSVRGHAMEEGHIGVAHLTRLRAAWTRSPWPMAPHREAWHHGPTLANAHAVFAMPWTLKCAMRCVASAATASNSGRSRMAKVVKAQAMLPQNGINRWHQGWRLYRQYSFLKYLWRSHIKKCLSSQVK